MTTLTSDELFTVAERLGVQTLPVVLSVAPQHDSYEGWLAVQRRAAGRLIAAGVFDAYGEVSTELAYALHTLANPERELVARIFQAADPGEPATVVRMCVARRGAEHAVAVRTGDAFEVGSVWSDGSGASLARPVLNVLGSCAPAEVADVSAPAQELSRRLDAATTTADYADACHALGVAARDATMLGLALGSCHAVAEIVAYAHHDGVTTRAPGAVAVYDTGRGRLVATPGIAADQLSWSTVAPGSDSRIAQSISALVEMLPGGRWLPKHGNL